MSEVNNIPSSSRFIGFFSLLMLLTLNGANGKDMLDVVVEYIEATTNAIRVETQIGINEATGGTLG